MRVKKIVVLLTCLLVAGAALASCGRNRPAGKLVGKWRSSLSKDHVIEFKSDGTLVGTPPSHGKPPITGKYEVEGENRVKLTGRDAEGFPDSSVMLVEFTGDGKKMRLSNEKGVAPMTYERVE